MCKQTKPHTQHFSIVIIIDTEFFTGVLNREYETYLSKKLQILICSIFVEKMVICVSEPLRWYFMVRSQLTIITIRFY